MDHSAELLKLRDYFTQLNIMAKTKVGLGDMYEDEVYRSVFSDAYRIVNLMLQIWLEEQGYETYDSVSLSDPSLDSEDGLPINFVKKKKVLPKECEDACQIIDRVHYMVVIPDKKTLITASCAFDEIEKWFLEELSSMHTIDVQVKQIIFDKAFSLVDTIMQSRVIQINDVDEVSPDFSKDVMPYLINFNRRLTRMEMMGMRHHDETVQKLDQLEIGQNVVSEQIGTLSGQIDALSEQILNLSGDIRVFQEQVTNQLKPITDPEEREQIIAEFADRCVEKVEAVVKRNLAEQMYEAEEQNLISSMGRGAWNKLEENSKNFLISAKVIFKRMDDFKDLIDYSGVCLLVTKALEVELKKRFYTEYRRYLNDTYASHYNNYPSSLLDSSGRPIPERNFTLGKVPFVMGFRRDRHWTDSEEQQNRQRIVEYCKIVLFHANEESQIQSLLNNYGSKINDITNDYRNPAAHTNELTQIDAEACFNLVLDVEKILKIMLDSFNF